MKSYSGKMILFLSLLSVFLLLSLGLWWLYLITHLGASVGADIASMVKWEGGTFILLISLLWMIFLYQYFKDRKRNQMIRDFFATMTHELKTPLSRVRLQTEVVAEAINMVSVDDGKRLTDLSQRLINDTQNLEYQLDKIIQLARVERGEKLSCEAIDLYDFIRDCHRKWVGERLELSFESSREYRPLIYADEFALEIIFRNLFENTFLHGKKRCVRISLVEDGKMVTLHYHDGHFFSGDSEKMGTLFYKHASKGAGIGLYLIKKLMQQMNGFFKVKNYQGLAFSLTFTCAGENTSV